MSTTTDSREEADRIARSVVENRLAACAQIIAPITSTYWWEGKIESAEELLILMKTTDDHVEDLINHIRSAHSYDTPEVIVTPITAGNPAYLEWVTSETKVR